MQMDHLFSQKVEPSELKNGDHVYTWRKKALYTHHGIFIGNGKIINFVQIKKPAYFAFSPRSCGEKTPCLDESYCGSEQVSGSGVRMSCIACFVRKSSLYRYEYNVRSAFLIFKGTPGTCTTASSDPQERVMHRVNYLYENGYPKYDMMNNNCEDFTLYCKTGLWSSDKDHQGRSSQANMVNGLVDVIKELLTDGSLMPPPRLDSMLRVSKAVSKSVWIRRANDLGKRTDVVKINVEDLSSYIYNLFNNIDE